MGVKIGVDAIKIGNNTHLLVVISVRILQKIGRLNLTNWTWFKEGNGYKYVHKVFAITGELV